MTSASANAIWTADDNDIAAARTTGVGKVYVGANEEVLCWDVKKGELLSRWRDGGCTAQVTAIAQSKTDPDVFAVGHADGSVRLWDSRIASVMMTFNGHRSAITTLAFDKQGVRLASGARDTDIIVWDLISESGMFKLRGHKDQITGLQFLEPLLEQTGEEPERTSRGDVGTFILSTSKDATIKMWDVASQYCVETHITQSNGECWALAVSPDQSGCITAGNDGELKVWSLDIESLKQAARRISTISDANFLQDRGILHRQARDRTVGINFHQKEDFFAVHGSDMKAVELWRIRSPVEVQKALARKRRRRREKAAVTGNKDGHDDTEMAEGDEPQEDVATADVSEVFVPYTTVRTGGKVKSIDWAGSRSGKNLQLVAATTNNQLEFYTISGQAKSKKAKSDEVPEHDRLFSVDLPGHRDPIRSISLSSDDRMLATASNGTLKIWNTRTQSCLRTLECSNATCCSFVPGDKIVIVGTKDGDLQLFDIASSALIETFKAHDGSIWALKVHPDGRSVVTGSGDKTAKFWNFEVVQVEIPGTRRTTPRLKLVHTRTMKVNDEILALCYSPDGRLLAVATYDYTVKVFFTDTLKLFLNLYGHKLPVLNISISSDNKIIATCSADKNVRLWGLDFGDCHKAFFAHDESIMQVMFIPHPLNREDVHMFFSASKDHTLKTWDGDKFQHVQKLTGHHGEVMAMAVSRTGDFVVSAAHDKSIRIWSLSDEPLFLEEEREKELEELYDNTLTNSLDKDQADEYALAERDGTTAEAVAASKQTSATLTAGEKITEALTICTEDLELHREHYATAGANAGPPQNRHPLLAHRNISAEQHLLSVFQAIPSAALHDALLLLSFTTLPSLFVFLSLWLEKEMNVPLTCRVLFFLLNTHHKQIVASRELRGALLEMQGKLRGTLGRWKAVMGFNLAATRVLGSRVEEDKTRTIEDVDERIEKGGGKKRAFVTVA